VVKHAFIIITFSRQGDRNLESLENKKVGQCLEVLINRNKSINKVRQGHLSRLSDLTSCTVCYRHIQNK